MSRRTEWLLAIIGSLLALAALLYAMTHDEGTGVTFLAGTTEIACSAS